MEKHLVKGTWGLRGPCQTARSATSCEAPVGAWLLCTVCVRRGGAGGGWDVYCICWRAG